MKPSMNKNLASLPPYIFVHLGKLKLEQINAGKDVIDLGQGSPDLPSPQHVIDAAVDGVKDGKLHGYPIANGLKEYRQAIADWYKGRFNADFDSDKEVLPLIGSKEGLGHLLMAILEPGDGVLVPSPCYPVHYNGVILAGGKVNLMPLKEKDGYIPDLDAISEETWKSSKAIILNYPNNPTGATLPDNSVLEKAIAYAKKYGTLVIYDNAYSEITFDGYKAPSIFDVPGAKEYAVEFHSTSKSYSMAGWRLGFVVGNAEVISSLAKLKGFLDYGVPTFLQKGAIAALTGPQDYVQTASKTYQERRDALAQALKEVGWEVPVPKASMYIWTALPEAAKDMKSIEFSERLIREQGVVVSPGSGFGPEGEGYMRFSLIQPPKRLQEAAKRIGTFIQSLQKAGVA
jgi:LL-diaminopimelate aminotransferase